MSRTLLLSLLFLVLAVPRVGAQGVVVDEGRFSISIGGRSVGTEEFSIRRAGFGPDDAIFANAVIRLQSAGGEQELRPLLRAAPPDGVATGYQMKVVGPDALEVQMTRSGRRYVAIIRSQAGEEDREFQAREDTRVVDRTVAHQYYFLRDLREGQAVHTLEPRSRTQAALTVTSSAETTLALGDTEVPARRVEFGAGDARRIVWFDRLGRVLRVEVPAAAYVAERLDLVG